MSETTTAAAVLPAGSPEVDPATMPFSARSADEPLEAGRKLRRSSPKVLRSWDWALPPQPVNHREVIAAVPTGWAEQSRASRKPPLLFIHGLAHGAWCFAEHWVGAAAAAGYPAYAMSLRGHGNSDGAAALKKTSMRDYVADVLQVITTLPEPPVLIGHSMGSLISQFVAARYPTRGLVLLTPPALSGSTGLLLNLAKREPGDVLAAVAGMTLPMRPSTLFHGLDAETALAYCRQMGREAPIAQYELLLPHRIGPVRAPVLVVGARNDTLVTAAAVEQTASAYGTTPLWLAEIGHDLMLDAGQDRAFAAVAAWLEVALPQTAGRL
jgi:pimeloyl-ACP methyl ester carboxylesterase